MTRPIDLPDMKTRPHGTRSRYVAGCRCADCRKANLAAYHARAERARYMASLLPNVETSPVPQQWTAPDGTRQTRMYKRGCPGMNGEPCATNSHLRSDSKAGICFRCRDRLVWNGIVSSKRARTHLSRLQKLGVGRRSIAAAADVGQTIIQEIKNGTATHIRAETERKLLAVTAEKARGGGNLVNAKPTRSRIIRLLNEGFTKKELARRLGYKAPALQLCSTERITARIEMKVERFYNRIMAI